MKQNVCKNAEYRYFYFAYYYFWGKAKIGVAA